MNLPFARVNKELKSDKTISDNSIIYFQQKIYVKDANLEIDNIIHLTNAPRKRFKTYRREQNLDERR